MEGMKGNFWHLEMSHFEGKLRQLLRCHIIRIIATVFNNRHIKIATTYKFFCSVLGLHIFMGYSFLYDFGIRN